MSIPKLFFLLASFIIIMSLLAPSYAQILQLTVRTDSLVYSVGGEITITGNLTYNGIPVSDGLVGLQINDRIYQPYIFRTLNTGVNPPGPWKIEVLDAYLGDLEGNPVMNAIAGSTYYLHIRYRNNEDYAIHTAFGLTVYDASNRAIKASVLAEGDILPGGPFLVGVSWRIPSDVELGTATVYGSAFSDLPADAGTPHCPEKSSSFNIVASAALLTSESLTANSFPIQLDGSFTHSFKFLNREIRIGTYTLYATSFYLGHSTLRTLFFELILMGDINGDLYVNIKDAVLLGVAFGSRPGDENWNPDADLNDDGFINIKDAVLVNFNFGNSAK